MSGSQQPPAITVIRPTGGLALPDLRELWTYRELLFFLTWRDLKVRYKQTVIGVAWVVLQPAAMMAVFSLIFGRFMGVSSDGLPYPLFALAGLLPWQLFSRSIAESSNSLITNQRLVSKVYFPKILIPSAVILAGLVDFLIAGALLASLMVWYGVVITLNLVWLPVFLALLIVTAAGIGFWLSALNVEYRDVAYTVPFINQAWFFVTPVVYPASIVPAPWRWLLGINPMTSVVEGFRWSLLGAGDFQGAALWVSLLTGTTFLVTGAVWFRRMERTFADSIGSSG